MMNDISFYENAGFKMSQDNLKLAIKASSLKHRTKVLCRYLFKNKKEYLTEKFLREMNYPLDLNKPLTYNQKIQWLKVYWRDPSLKNFIDKFKARSIVQQRGCGEILTKLYGVWTDPCKIDYDSLPDKFVIKTNNSSGYTIFVHDKSKLNTSILNSLLKRLLKVKYHRFYMEWGYKGITPLIICEEYIDENKYDPMDYKLYCFNGKVKLVRIVDNYENEPRNISVDENFKRIDCAFGFDDIEYNFPKPEKFDDMIRYAEKLSDGFNHVRIDFLYSKGKLYFSEFTLYSASGYDDFVPIKYDYFYGDMLTLPKKSKESW